MSKNRFKRTRRRYRRGRSLSASMWGPILKLLLTIAIIAGLLWAVFYVALPKASEFIGFEYRAPFAPKPTPSPTPRPEPTPDPMELYDFAVNSIEVVFDGSSSYKWFADPYFYGDKLAISAGQLDEEGRKVVFSKLFMFDPASRTAEQVKITPANAHIMFPKFNESWLVYLDGNIDGGGAIMAVDLTAAVLKPVKLKDIYSGQPEPMLDGNFVAFTDRTGTRRDKLYVYDLTTMESSVVAMFSNSVYGQSKPSLNDSLLLWADSATSDGNSDTSMINSIKLGSSTVATFQPGAFVHDPESNGSFTAWLTELHSRSTALYGMKGLSGEPFLIDNGVVEFGLGSNFAAYSRNQGIFVYMFETGKIYRITQEYEYAQFLGVSDDRVIWMDVTSRERDIVKFVEIP